MKVGIIIVLYKTPQKDKLRLKKEFAQLGFSKYKFYFIDNSKNNLGYAHGVNEGLKKALSESCDYFIIANPDISITEFNKDIVMNPGKIFDVWGFAMMQNNKIYYGGEIDKLQASGGLIDKKPVSQFVSSDFISGSFMVLKKKVIEKIGYFDDAYFMYYEDVDYCIRAKKAEFSIGFDSQHVYKHYEVSSKNKLKASYLTRSHQLFIQKQGTLQQKMFQFCKRIIKSPFLINFMSMNMSSFLSHVLHFVHVIFLIKYLNSTEYGLYTLVWAQVLLLSPLVDFGTTSYGVVHLPTEKPSMISSLINLRIALSVIIFFITIISSLFFFGSSTKLYIYILITATVIFTNTISGSYFILNSIRNKLYVSSRNSILFNSVIIICSIISLIFWQRLLYVFLIIFVGYNTYSFITFYLLKKELTLFHFRIDWTIWKKILAQSYVYVLISFFAGLYFKIDLFMLQAFKGTSDVGVYSAGYKFFEALIFIAVSYNVSATPTLSRLKNDSNLLLRKIIRDSAFLISIGFFVVIGTWIFAPLVLPLVFKTTFIPSIWVLKIVIFALPCILFNSILMNVLYVLNKAQYVIILFIIQTVINITLNYFIIPKYSYYGSSVITVISELINGILLLLICMRVWNRVYGNKSYEYKH